MSHSRSSRLFHNTACHLPILLGWIMMASTVACSSYVSADELGDIIASYRRQTEDVQSLSVEYHTTTSLLSSPEDVVQYLNYQYLEDTRETLSFKAGMRHQTRVHNSPSYNHLTERQPDGSPERVLVAESYEHAYNGSLLYKSDGSKLWRKPPVGSIDPVESIADDDNTAFLQTYLSIMLRGLPDSFGKDSSRKPSLVGLGEQSLLKLKPQRETVDGVECVVIEWREEGDAGPESQPGSSLAVRHTIWCDPALSYAIRQHEVALDDRKILTLHVTFQDFRAVVPGVWYPERVIMDTYPSPQGSREVPLGKALLRYDLVVDKIHANDLSDEMFTLKFPPGTMVRDGRYKKDDGSDAVYIQPASERELDAILKNVKQNDWPLPPRRFRFSKLLLANAILLVVIVVVGLVRRRRSTV